MASLAVSETILQDRRKERCNWPCEMQVCFTGISPLPPSSAPLDSFDLAILAILQRDNTTPQRLIGEAVNLSAPAVQRRIKRMEQTGVIASNVAIIEPAAVGQSITIFVEVELESERTELIDAAKRQFSQTPEVQQCYYVTGETDFILIMNTRDMDEYTALTRELFFEGGNVKSFRTCVTMEKVKADGPIPL